VARPKTLAALTDPRAVLHALREFDRLGRDQFLSVHGFRAARGYFLRHEGRRYDSKAIAGVAVGYQHGRALGPGDFSGGEQTVWRTFRRLGFDIEHPGRPLRVEGALTQPTASTADLEKRTRALLTAAARAGVPLPQPKGQARPRRTRTQRSEFCRDPWVRAFVLQRADGKCELCALPPFVDDAGDPYLEVHHLHRLADGGPDIVQNAAALCANCHRELHCGRDRSKRVAALRRRVPALKGS
jgi:hypothetical protein